MKTILTIILTLLALALGILVLTLNLADAQNTGKDVTVSWDANSEPDLAGYKVYIGESSRSYGGNHDVGDRTSWTWNDLAVGKTYYFAVTAYDTAGNESEYSEEVSIALDVPDKPPAPPQNVRVVIEGNTWRNRQRRLEWSF